jgi:D-3-phosphoglycerate dehydrogenase
VPELLVIGAPSGTARDAVTGPLRGRDLRISFWPGPETVTAEARGRARWVVTDGAPAGEEFIGSLPLLRAWIRVVGSGNRFRSEREALIRRAVAVRGGAPAGSARETAEFAVMLMLNLLRRMPEAESALRAGDRARVEAISHATSSLADETVGIIGLGEIGRATALLLRAHGAAVLHTRTAGPEQCCAGAGGQYGEHVSTGELLARSGIVSLHLKQPPGSCYVTREFLARMRPGAMLVNTAQGHLLDEQALADALAGGSLRAAALDVFAHEPQPSGVLLAAPNLILTPHVAGKTRNVGHRLWSEACAALIETGSLPDPIG